jgi:D-glycero-alpha-D-manno-heptose-7-phosphate kinase
MVSYNSGPRSVTTITPLRVSFAGGGTDLPDFYRKHGGAVVSTAIDKYIYVTVKQHSPLFNETYRLSYSKTEHVERLDDIENDIARECLRLIPLEPPLFISTAADLPAQSGLGSSSSFAVGLLYALHVMRGEEVSAGQLAEEACQVEIGMLRRPIGKQDQFAAAYGGCNYIAFANDDRVTMEHLWLPSDMMNVIFRNSMLFWTGMQRDASAILDEQKTNIANKTQTLMAMRDMALKCRKDLVDGIRDIDAFGKMLDEGWRAKRTLASKIAPQAIDDIYQKALDAGAIGGKITGAGGGGFLFLMVPESRQDSVRAALSGLRDIKLGYEPRGARILSTVY